ncbi:Cytochrome c [Pirellula sp. SH-Sr6A]|uniref:PVC-type heme-binding CxxCH protein n=1 Tax=Pirellula sp. SH-Sr6A TaxID=1632865 RepID=UPI00078CEFDE|nr:PVC-type heme-binding CxxCH protein [Pirellula sp. SH-Sr6A]AMV30755.1 Cytochrome c [Pirellula sp. SH-Sr6A]
MQISLPVARVFAPLAMAWLWTTLLHLVANIPCIADDFPPIQNSEKSTSLPLSPSETVAQARLPDGFQLSVVASEPQVQNPIAMTTDERGRIWIAENYSWSGNGAGGFDPKQRDRVVILEDSDGDGSFDSRKVFADDVHKLTSIEIGNGGVWAISLPNLLFFPDRDRDDSPDSAPIVVLNGFDEEAVGHTPANGLKWGNDGWLYGRHGIQATSSIGPPEASDSQRIKINTGVWRFHPISKRVESVLHGMTNSWGFDFDEHGEMFVINTVIGHLWHVVPGAHVERMYGIDINPHTYQLIEQTADHVHWDTGEKWNEIQKGMSNQTDAAGGGHAHIGLMIYQGDNWPESYRHKLFTLNLHGLRINSNSLERQGTAYVGRRAPDFAFFSDTWFRGMELITAPDGSVLIADWSDTGECHDHDGVHRTSGRVYRLSYQSPRAMTPFDLTKESNEKLVKYLSHPNAWWARTARRVLSERLADADEATRTSVQSLVHNGIAQSDTPAILLRHVEAAFQSGLVVESHLHQLLQHDSEHVRVAAIRFLTDSCQPSDSVLSSQSLGHLQQLAEKDPSGLVHLYLASALQKLPAEQRWTIAKALSRKGQWANDRSFPKMLWYGIEGAVPSNPAEAIGLIADSQIPLVTENVSRRLTLLIESQPAVVDSLVESACVDGFTQAGDVVRGMAKALEGWQKAKPPKGWEKLSNLVSSTPEHGVTKELQTLRLTFGDGRAKEDLLALIQNGGLDPEVRKQALRSLLASKPQDLSPRLLQWLGDRALVLEAIRGLAFYDHPETAKQLLNRWKGLSPAERTEAINTLASRPTTAKELLEAVRSNRISPSEISAFHARQIQSFGDESLTLQLQEVWGEIKATTAERKAWMDQWRNKMTSEFVAGADLSSGRALFQQHCSNCHVLYGIGKRIGPDLTGSNRRNLDYLLENIGDPSASVGAEFRTSIFQLVDDRVITGAVVDRTDRTVTIQTAQERVTIDKQEIAATKLSATSLMPDGLLQNLSEHQVRDLLSYLMHESQVSLPE